MPCHPPAPGMSQDGGSGAVTSSALERRARVTHSTPGRAVLARHQQPCAGGTDPQRPQEGQGKPPPPPSPPPLCSRSRLGRNMSHSLQAVQGPAGTAIYTPCLKKNTGECLWYKVLAVKKTPNNFASVKTSKNCFPQGRSRIYIC